MDACDVFGFRIKYFITCQAVDEELLRKQAHLLFDPSGLEERFLGIRWDLKHDVLRPVKYLGLSKLRGKIIGELNKDNIGVLPNTHRMELCILAQHYDVRGVYLNPAVMSFKILLSRACQLAGHTDLDLDLTEKDQYFAVLFRDLTLKLIEGFDDICPFDRVLVRAGHVPVAYQE